MKEEYYAIYIQSLWRGYKQRCEFERMIEDMEKQLFEDEQGGASKLKLKSDEVGIAAVKMQAMWRGANARSQLLKQLEDFEGAQDLQNN